VRGCNPDFLVSPLRSRDRLRPVRRCHMLPYPVPATRRRSADMAGAPPFAGASPIRGGRRRRSTAPCAGSRRRACVPAWQSGGEGLGFQTAHMKAFPCPSDC